MHKAILQTSEAEIYILNYSILRGQVHKLGRQAFVKRITYGQYIKYCVVHMQRVRFVITT